MNRQQQLDAVVRNHGEWCGNSDFPFVVFEGDDCHYIADEGPFSLGDDGTMHAFTRAEVEARKVELQNKPSWDDAPEWAVSLSQDPDGTWLCWNIDRKYIDAGDSGRNFWVHDAEGIKVMCIKFRKGEVIGDWRDTLEEVKREPKVKGLSVKVVDKITDTTYCTLPEIRAQAHDTPTRTGHDIDPICEPSDFEDEAFAEIEQKLESQKTMSERYPAYFKDVSDLQELDVYATHKLFGIDDPSGAIQHASKKLLLSGARTGGKSKYQDVKEARDALNRWLELNGGDK